MASAAWFHDRFIDVAPVGQEEGRWLPGGLLDVVKQN
jgi:hypothetical protein